MDPSTKLSQKDRWDKVIIAAEILAIAAIIVYGNIISASLMEREIDLRLVQVAVEVLQTEPNTTTMTLRGWAIENNRRSIWYSAKPKSNGRTSPKTITNNVERQSNMERQRYVERLVIEATQSAG